MVIGHPLKTKNLDLPEVLALSDVHKVRQATTLIIDENLTGMSTSGV